MPKALTTALQVTVNPGCASGGAGDGGRTLSLRTPCQRVLVVCSAAGCLEQGPGSEMRGRCMDAELVRL